MIAGFVQVLRPIVEPLLRLRLAPPHLPEEASHVRHLKPGDAYLSYRYLGVGLLVLVKLIGAVGIGIGAMLSSAKWLEILDLVLLGVILVLAAILLVARRIEWELSDYLLGERSLRVRSGALVQREITLSFANIQNVEVVQGPLERLFGIKSVRVTTAGGGAPTPEQTGGSPHEAVLFGLSNADEVRELLLRTVRRDTATGLGDADDGTQGEGETRSRRLQEVLEAAKGLRIAAEQRAAPGPATRSSAPA